jgi:cell division protein FtsB
MQNTAPTVDQISRHAISTVTQTVDRLTDTIAAYVREIERLKKRIAELEDGADE